MGAPKGSKNTYEFNKKRQDKVIQLITSTLKSVNKTGVAFKNINTIAEYIAPMVGQSAGNLSRNKRYRVLLEKHLSEQKGAVHLLDESHNDINLLKAKNRVLELEKLDAINQIARLKQYIEKYADVQDQLKIQNKRSGKGDAGPKSQSDAAFKNTAELLLAVIERSGFRVNEKDGVIDDPSARPGKKAIATKAKSKWFIGYCKKQGL